MSELSRQQTEIWELRKKLAEAKLRNEELEEMLAPFLLFSNVYEGRDDIGTVLLQKGNQSLTVSCFTSLLEEMKKRRGTAFMLDPEEGL